MVVSEVAGKLAKKFQNSKINKKLTKKLDDVTSSLKSKTKNITEKNIAKKTKEEMPKSVNTVLDKAKNIANKTLKDSNSLKKGIKNYFSSKKKGAVRLDVLLPEKLFGEEIVENAEETITEQTLKKAQVQYDANNLEIASSISRLIPGTPGVVTGGSSTKLGENLFEYMGLKRTTKRTPYQAMHIIPKRFKNNPIIKKIGMDFDDASNGIFLRNRDSGGVSPMSRHQGNHSVFDDFIREQLDNMDINLSVRELEEQVYNLQQKSKKLMQQGLPMYPKENASKELWKRWFNKI